MSDTHDPERQREIADIIRMQAGRMVLIGNVGARNYAFLSETEERSGGLEFTASNGHWIGRVELTWVDDYVVTYLTKKSGRIGFQQKRVYCDQLAETLIVGLDAAMFPRSAA